MAKLSKNLGVEEFDNNYFYAAELKSFLQEIGVKSFNARKIEMEQLVRQYLATGNVPEYVPTLARQNEKSRDELSAGVLVVDYVGDRKTKEFLLSLVEQSIGTFKSKSGQWYWLNDWRRQKQEIKAQFTYQDLADHLQSLIETEGRLPQIPSARMNNFLSDFLADKQNKGKSRGEALKAWEYLKTQSGPKTYEHFLKLRNG